MKITFEDLLNLIDINPPYFAFKELEWDGSSMHSHVPVEQPLENEAGPITAAEASRHLAILGVCSCAMVNPVKKRHYYLASRGIYERVSDAPCDPTKLTAKATCLSLDKKKAEAITELFDQDGNVIVRLRVFYHVILDVLFERLYKEYYIESPDFKLSNPYKYVHKMKSETIDKSKITCEMGPVPQYYCAGHFPNFPALPVAVLVYNLFNSATKLITKAEGFANSKCVILNYEITADNLAFAGDDVELQVTRLDRLNSNYHFMFAEGIANGTKSVGKIDLLLKKINTLEPATTLIQEEVLVN